MIYEKGERVIGGKGSHGVVTHVTGGITSPRWYSVMWDGEPYSWGGYTAEELKPEKEIVPMFRKNDRVVKSTDDTSNVGVGTVVYVKKLKNEYRYNVLWDNYPDGAFYNCTEDELIPAPVEKTVTAAVKLIDARREEIDDQIAELKQEYDRLTMAGETLQKLGQNDKV